MSGPYAPLEDADRAHALDSLRAFALFGIFVSHVPDFSGFNALPEAAQAAHDRFGIDAELGTLLHFLIKGKFFQLFSLLFGIGFAVQLDSALRNGRNFARHFARRLAILLLIGLVHACLWYGDILKDYALIGLLLIATARWKPASIGIAAIVVLILRALWPLAMWAALAPATPPAPEAAPQAHFFALMQTFAGNDVAAMLTANLDLLRLKALQMIYDGKAISILAMFLLGAYIGKRRLYRGLASNTRLFRRTFAICAPIGILGNALLVTLDATTPDYPPSLMWAGEQMLAAIAVPALTLTYAAGFVLFWIKYDGAFLSALAPAGRMALTNYVSQTLIGIAAFYGVGGGLSGSFGLTDCVAFAVAVFAAQCVASALWLSALRFGPLEWLWRRATYGTPLPMLKWRQATA